MLAGYTLTSSQCRLNVGQRLKQWPNIRLMHVTQTHCRVNGELGGIVEPARCLDTMLG